MNYADRDGFRFHAAHPGHTAFFSLRSRSKVDGTRNITVTRRFNRPDGGFGGVVAVSISVQFLQELLDDFRARSGGVIGLMAEDGRIVVRSPSVPEYAQAFSGGPQFKQLLQRHPVMDSYSYTSAIDGVRRRGSLRHLEPYPLVVLVSQSERDLQAGWRRELQWHTMIIAGILTVVAAFGRRAVKASRLLRAQVMQDGLTGLANRRYFDETIEQEFRRATRKGQPVAVIMIDLDHFKEYNDRYGHLAGDECLRVVAHAIQGCLRRAGEFAARYGGEEIVVVLPDADSARANTLAMRMQAAVHALALRHESHASGVVTFSGGVATCVPRPRTDGWRGLVAKADAALYAAKAKGRDIVVSC